MRTSIALSVLLLAAASNAAPVKVALPGLNGVQLDQKLADFLNEQLAQELSNQGVDVVTSKEVQALLGMERQKQLLGCNEQSSCMAELADALGSDAVLIGDVARVGARYHLTLKAMAAGTGTRLTDFSGSGDKEEDLVGLAAKAAAKMAPELSAQTKKPLGEKRPGSSVSTAGAGTGSVVPLGLLVGGGVVLAAGGAFEFMAYQNYNRLKNGEVKSLNEADNLRSDGKMFNAFGLVGMGVGAAALATGIALKFTTGSDAQAAIAPTHNGLVLAGSFP